MEIENPTNQEDDILSKASELYSEIKDTTDMDEVDPAALEEYLEMLNDYIIDISANNFATERDDGLTKEGILIDLENMKTRINGLLRRGGRSRNTRKSRRSRRSRRSTKTRRSTKSRSTKKSRKTR